MNIREYMLKHRITYVFAILSLLISVTLDMCAPLITKHIIDDVIIGGNMELLMRLLLSLVGIGIGRAIFQYVKEYLFDLASVKIACDMRGTLFKHIQKLSLSFFDKSNTGELLARLKDDIDKVWFFTGFAGMLTIESLIHTAAVIYCMVKISPSLTLIPLMVTPIIAFTAIRLENKLGKIYDEISEANADLNTIAQENLAGVRTVKAFAREEFEIKKFKNQNKKYYDLNMNQAKAFAKRYPNITFLAKSMIFIILFFGGSSVIAGGLTLGSLSAFVEYANNIIWPMEIMGFLSNDIASAFASNKKIRKVMKEVAEIKEPTNPVKLEHIQGNLEFCHVDLSLDGNTILEDVNFKLDKGKTIGIMGMTGSGKSSIVNLIQRFYDVTKGEILLDGVNIKELPLADLRRSTALVMQDVFLFSDTISENIKIGNKHNLDEAAVRNASSYAGASGFIEKLSEQYDTIIGERGVGLSGGQKQRISIARAMSKEAPILILDDSTSALDMETEFEIQQRLMKMEHVTKIIIAHRISAVRNADEIVILEDGKIVERGNHETLMKKRGLYYDTYVVQYEDIDEQIA